MNWGKFTKEYKDDFNNDMMVYYVKPNGESGCCCSVKEFDRVKHRYKDCLLIVAPPNAPLYFRKA